MDSDQTSTPQSRPQTRSRTLSSGSRASSTSEKRKRSPDLLGNMSKKTAQDEPSNSQIMRALTVMNAKFDKLPTVEHLNKLENELHVKMERNNEALKEEIRAEFKAEMKQQASKMNQMVAEVRVQMATNQPTLGSNIRNDQQKGRYLRARRSFKIWPINKQQGGRLDDLVKRFFIDKMGVPEEVAFEARLDTVRPADQARNSRIKQEYIVTFADVDTRDAIKSYANGLAAFRGDAGLRLDVPPCLKGSFKVLNEHGISMVNMYGREVKRNIRFDDRNEDLMMDLKLPTSATWHNITIEQAREAKKARDAMDIQNIRQAALVHKNNGGIGREQARALMLAISPGKEGGTLPGAKVVHINNTEDWRQFEDSNDDQDSLNKSVEEILRGGSTRRGTATGSGSSQRS